jgi:translation initiation factor 3 subunit D
MNSQHRVSPLGVIDRTAQRGAVLATELKNNSFKLAKWTAASLLSGADQMKIGFVSRTSPKNAYEHVILATQFYRPKDFTTQISLSEGQMWAMIRMFIQLMQKHPEGKYVLMRDPNKATLRLFKVPANTFEEEDEEEEENADEGEGSEE